MTELCTYCGDERGGKLGCCGEVHFYDVSEDELTYMEENNIGVDELQDKREEFDSWIKKMEQHQPCED